MLKIKDMKPDQFFWYAPKEWKPGDKELLCVYGKPRITDGLWRLEATCGGDYAWSLDESDEAFMYNEEEMNY